jgi:SP family xylose:H+ symportor-like MFS transporter
MVHKVNNSNTGHYAYVSMISLVATLGGLLFGYDTAVISGTIGFLRVHFGLDPAMTGWIASSALVGCVAGCAVAGMFSDRYGRKKALIAAACLFTLSAIGSALAGSGTELVLWRIAGGLGIGIASMLSPLYIAEVAPASIRGKLVSYNQFAIIFGMVIVYLVNYYIAGLFDETWNIETGWRWMFASGTIPAILFFILLFFVPESPRWLAGADLADKARTVLKRIGGTEYAEKELQSIRDSFVEESGGFKMLFKGSIRKLMLLGIVLAVLQQVTGINVFLYYAPEIFRKLGTEADTALLQTVVVGIFNLGFTIVAIFTVDKLGRRPLMLIGSAGMGICLFSMGLLAFFQQAQLWVLAFILGYISFFALSVGPVTWVILSEIFPTRIRGRAISLATIFLWTANWMVSQTFPMLNESPVLVEKFHHGFTFWIYGIMCIVLLLVVHRLVPETKGRSLEEIEANFRTDL